MRFSLSSATGGTCAAMVCFLVLSVVAVGVEVAQQGDLGPVVDQLAVDVKHERGAGELGVGPLGRAAWLGQIVLSPAANAVEPRGIRGVQLGEGGVCRAGVVEGLVVGLRTIEVVLCPCPENAHDDVSEPPRD